MGYFRLSNIDLAQYLAIKIG